MNSYTFVSDDTNKLSSRFLRVTINFLILNTKALIVLDWIYGLVPASPTSIVCKSWEQALKGLRISFICENPSSANFLIFIFELLMAEMSSITIYLNRSRIGPRTYSAGWSLNLVAAFRKALIKCSRCFVACPFIIGVISVLIWDSSSTRWIS